MPNRVSISFDHDDSSPRDPTARCDRCGRTGTVARLTRYDSTPPAVERFCDACWQPRRAELEPLGIGTSWKVLSWAFVLESVREIEDGVAEARSSGRSSPAAMAEFRGYLREMAEGIVARAHEIDGPMPPEVAEFIRRHHDPVA